jgi:hypothetical protein
MRAQGRLIDRPGDGDRDLRVRVVIQCLMQLDVLPLTCRRKDCRWDNCLGLALFLPSYLFMVWKLLTG